ncbi:MAG: trigger factor [Planctomycetaceae bacterium]|jgi:trigger factor|nr:trigger factor [Planctomycetaceae bacterium]
MSATDTELDMDLDENTDLLLTTSVKVVSSCERVIEVTIPRGEVERYFNKQFDEIQRDAHIPGFRQGKTPRDLIEKKFRRDVQDYVKRNLVSDAMQVLNKEINLVPISEPNINVEEYVIPDKGPFVFSFSIEVRPDFELPEWRGLQIDKPVREVNAEDIEREIDTILAEHGTLIPIDAPAEKGNFLEVNITAAFDGVEVNSRENEIVCVKKGLVFSDGLIDDFEKLAVGAKAGDTIKTSVNVSDFAKKISLRGKSVDVTFEVLGVKRIELPEISPPLLQKLGGFCDAADFRDSVLDKLKERIAFAQHSQIRQQITNNLSVATTWELPEEFLSRQAEREFKRAEYELMHSGFSQEQITLQSNLLRQNSNAATAKALKEHFILEKIAETENITDTEEDYNQEIETIAKKSGMSPRKLRAIVEKGGQMDILRNQIIERKVIQLIAQDAVFTDVPFNFELLDTYALKWSIAGGDKEVINTASAEDLKAVHKEMEYKKRFDPNTKIN